jgi:hypothetical protein
VVNKIMIQGNTVRIAAVAAFLACSLLGRPLHELQHHAESLPAGKTSEHSSAGVSCTSSKTLTGSHNCGGGSHSRVVNADQPGSHSHREGSPRHEPESDHRGHSHDSHDCSVCQALCVSATTPNCTSACLRPDVCVGRHSVFSESAAASALHVADARGPPCLS